MSRLAAIVLLLCLSTAASALTPAITSITPNVLPLEGGFIAVRTDGWATSECGNICNIDVVIGGEQLPRSALYFYGLTLTVQVPPRTKTGYARFELHHPYGEPAIVENAILFVDSSEHETVLLPLSGTTLSAIPGAFGSLWKTSTLVINDSDRSLTIDTPPAHIQLPPQSVTLQPHSTSRLELALTGPIVVRVPRAFADQVYFQTRAYDDSRTATNFGTRVASVREREFHTSRITIGEVPTMHPFRASLRIYSPDRMPRAFHVAVNGTVLNATTTTAYPLEPWSVPFADILLPASGNDPVQVVIEPVDDGIAPFYAFVSVTNNETQHVTLLTPR